MSCRDTKRIALIIPYFGNFKNYFPLFLTSCKNNPTIDWLIFTDTEVEYAYPPNVHVTHIDFEGFRKRVQDNFNFAICLDRPYKLCDFKPAYGEIFREELTDYDYWGYCDCDLIFGDIRHFLTADILESNCKIFTRGHLTIWHNDDITNSYYKVQTYVDYKKVLMRPQPFSFDEWPGISKAWDMDEKPYFDGLCMDDILCSRDGFHPTKKISGYGKPYNRQNSDESKRYKQMKNIIYIYRHGKLNRMWRERGNVQEEEILYVHFQKRNFNVELPNSKADSFIVVPNSFIEDQPVNISSLKKLNPDRLTLKNVKASVNHLLGRGL